MTNSLGTICWCKVVLTTLPVMEGESQAKFNIDLCLVLSHIKVSGVSVYIFYNMCAKVQDLATLHVFTVDLGKQ